MTYSPQIELLKWIAIFTMVLDHGIKIFNQGFVYIPGVSELTRVSFPLFTFVLAYNYMYHTYDKVAYLKRLFVFALISQPFFMLAFNTYFLNIFFVLFFGLSMIYLLEQMNERQGNIYTQIFLLLFIFCLSVLADYGVFGLLLVLVSFRLAMVINYQKEYLFGFLKICNLKKSSFLSRKNIKDKSLKEKIFFNLTLFFFAIIFANLIGMIIIKHYMFVVIGAILTIALIINVPKLKIPRVNKYVFYVFYPVHLLILWGVNEIFFIA